LEDVEGSPQNFSIIRFVVRELHWLEVEGVVVKFMEGFP
jgi:hypothetical protein